MLGLEIEQPLRALILAWF